MKFSGSQKLQVPQSAAYHALLDPAVLRQVVPGCRKLVETGEHRFDVELSVGVPAVRGDYTGAIVISDTNEPRSYRMDIDLSGSMGFVKADASIDLDTAEADEKASTMVSYDANALFGGDIAGVGQRVIEGVTRHQVALLFQNVDRVLMGRPVGIRARIAHALRSPARLLRRVLRRSAGEARP